MSPERRKCPRKRIEKLVYIHLEPENGAIVLDASEGGLAFHAAGPIEGIGPIHFYVSIEGRRRLEVCGEVIWMDATRKTGGLRFINVPDDSGELRAWLGRLLGERTSTEVSIPVAAASASEAVGSPTAPAKTSKLASAVIVAQARSETSEMRATAGEAEAKAKAEAVALQPTTPRPEAPQPAAALQPKTPEPQTPKPAAPLPTTTSGGIAKTGAASPALEVKRRHLSATGIGFYAFSWFGVLCWMGAGMFVCRNQVGRSLVQMGEWLGDGQQRGLPNLPKTNSPTQETVQQSFGARRVSAVGAPAGATPGLESSAQQAESSGASLTAQQLAMRQLDDEIAALEQVYASDSDPYPGRARPSGQRLAARADGTGKGGGSAEPVRIAANAPNEAQHKTGAPRGASLVANISPFSGSRSGGDWFIGDYRTENGWPDPPPSNPNTSNPPLGASRGAQAALETATGSSDESRAKGESPAKEDADPTSDSYLDVGRYKEMPQAHEAASELKRLGFQTRIVRKRLLWMNSFHVMVGPYRNDKEADAARATLEPMGLRPRFASAP